jgi:hypothetical protein
MINRLVGTELFQTDRQTDMTKAVVRNFAKAFKNFVRKLWSYDFGLMKLKKNDVICAFTSVNNPFWCW